MRSFTELFKRMPADGGSRHALRTFNMAPNIDGKARSVKELAISLGFSVQLMELPRMMAGRLVADPFSENGFCIEVNRLHSVQSNRFAVLHEIGHYFLHVNKSDPLADPMYLDRSASAFYLDTKQENEANQFAATVLFGDGALKAMVTLHGANKDKLAKCFGVSARVIEIALRDYC